MATKRKLNVNPEETWATTGRVVDQPSVYEFPNDEGGKFYEPVYSVGTQMIDGQYHVLLGMVGKTSAYPIDKLADIKVNESKGTLSFSSYGNMYTLRAFQDTDGSWASKFRIDVPAESIEERFMATVEKAFSPNAPADDENLYVAVDDDGKVRELVYSSAAGLFIRSSDSWFKLPVGDESLDDLTVMEMDPKVIKMFDMAEADGAGLMADDVKRFEVEFRGGV